MSCLVPLNAIRPRSQTAQGFQSEIAGHYSSIRTTGQSLTNIMRISSIASASMIYWRLWRPTVARERSAMIGAVPAAYQVRLAVRTSRRCPSGVGR